MNHSKKIICEITVFKAQSNLTFKDTRLMQMAFEDV